jgi:hypothetical protein
MRNHRVSPLLRLPTELRIQVYEYVLGGYELRFKCQDHVYPPSITGIERAEAPDWHFPEHLLALTHVCRQTHADCGSIPTALNEFSGTIWRLSIALRIVSSAYQQFKFLRTVRIFVGHADVAQRQILPPAPVRECLPNFVNLLRILGALPRLALVIVEWIPVVYHGWDILKDSLEKTVESNLSRLSVQEKAITVQVVPWDQLRCFY